MVGIMMMPNDSPKKTLFVALMLSLVCSVLVAGAAVLLKPIQEANKQANVKVNILSVAGLLEVGAKVDELFRRIEPKVVDLNTGEYAADIDPATYDMRKATQDPALSAPVPAEKDIASIKRRPQYATVYRVKDGERLKLIILPIKGYG
ncbi:MAG: Na(+)-translocating NADH-quinone reductase subunit C, partial [Pseudomonadota bacterium]|nr:Na(+)-translocating NADH-quinone reductase subunit C [Pseudomonadota bacterium]